jgi:hypothetical protein
MMRVKALVLGLLLSLGASGAWAQTGCQGQPAAGGTCGNPNATAGLPSWATMTALLDRNFGGPSVQGTMLNRGASVWSATATPTLGLNGGTGGSLTLNGATSGSALISVQAAAGTGTIFQLPNTNGIGGQQLITDGAGHLSWSSAGAGTVTSVGLALPVAIFTISNSPVTNTGTLTGTLATQTANTVWAGPTTGAAASPTFRALVGADLPNPSASTLGGVQSFAAVGSQWIRQISTSGVPTASQPAFIDISGSVAAAQLPNPTASTLGGIESLAAVTSKWINTISTSGVPSATQPAFSDISGNASLAQLPSVGNGTLISNISGSTSTPLANSLTSIIDSVIGATQGQVLYRSGTVWTALSPGTAGQVLTTAGAAANPSWTSVGGTGTVTNVATNNGVTGGPITTTGTIGLASISTGNVLANTSGISAAPSATTPTSVLDVIGSTQGSVLYRGASVWTALTPGTNGQFLQTTGAGSTPQWNTAVTGPGSAVSGHIATFNGTSGSIIQDGGIPNTGVREAILAGSVDTTGFPNFSVIGSGLNVNLTATATPLTMSFAAGFNAVVGPVDFVGQLAADTTSYWASLPSNQYSFLSVDRNASTGALTATQTLMPPQRGAVFYSPRQALLHFDASTFADDWGNTWVGVGAGLTFTAPCAKFGALGINITGTSTYVQTTSIFNPGLGNWTMDVWANINSNVSQSIFSVGNSFGVYLATNASGKLILFLSSGGASWDISPGTSPGATTVTTGAFHHFALVFNGASYVAYLDGVAQLTVSSSTRVWPDGVAMAVAGQVGVGAGTAGCFDEFDFVPFARWVANFTPPVAAYTVSGDWFDSNKMVMNTATGAGPTWSTVQRLYVAEAQAGASTITAVYDYSASHQYTGSDFAVSGAGKLRIGNHVIYAEGTPQFITGSTPGTACTTVPACTIGSPVTWVMTPSQVPPDAKWFDIQINVFHAAIGGTNPGNSDCTLQSRIPIGTVQGYIALGAEYNNYSGFGAVTNTSAFNESAGTIARFPVLNGVAAFETSIGGGTCTTGGTNNQARIVTGILIGYEMP